MQASHLKTVDGDSKPSGYLEAASSPDSPSILSFSNSVSWGNSRKSLDWKYLAESTWQRIEDDISPIAK